jgi:hypothetical protein
MRVFLLVIALALTMATYPATYGIAAHNGRDGQPAALLLVLLCLLRGLVITGTGFGWALVMEVACAGLLILSIDPAVRAPFPVLFGVLGVVGPLVAIGGVWVGQRRVVWAAVAVLVVVRLGAWAGYWPLTAPWREERMRISR